MVRTEHDDERHSAGGTLECIPFWTTGLSLRRFANACARHWRLMLPLATAFKIPALLVFSDVIPCFLVRCRMVKAIVVGYNPASCGLVEERVKRWSLSSPAMVTLGRIGTPTEVAKLVSYLASDDASYITGTTVVIDGGLMRQTGSL